MVRIDQYDTVFVRQAHHRNGGRMSVDLTITSFHKANTCHLRRSFGLIGYISHVNLNHNEHAQTHLAAYKTLLQ